MLSLFYVLLALLICNKYFASSVFVPVENSSRPCYKNANYVRVVEDLQVIYGCHGVPLDFCYNETNDNPDEVTSPAGCPQSIDGLPWIYYGEPPRCHLAGHHGPCPVAEKLLIQIGSPYGVCACDCLAEDDYSKNLQGPDRFVGCDREDDLIPLQHVLIFDKLENICYLKYERGPCAEEGTVITGYNGTSLECLPLCNKEEKGWEEMEDQGLCATIKAVKANSFSINPNECPEDEMWSKIFKKCVKRSRHSLFIPG